MDDIVFVVLSEPAGGYVARALKTSVFSAADTLDDLRHRLRDAVLCHYDENGRPARIRAYHLRSPSSVVMARLDSLRATPAHGEKPGSTEPGNAELPDIVPLWTDCGPPYLAEPERDSFERFAELMEVVELLCPQWLVREPGAGRGDFRM